MTIEYETEIGEGQFHAGMSPGDATLVAGSVIAERLEAIVRYQENTLVMLDRVVGRLENIESRTSNARCVRGWSLTVGARAPQAARSPRRSATAPQSSFCPSTT